MYEYEHDPGNPAYPYRVSNPDTGEIFWVESEKKARAIVEQGNSRFVLPGTDDSISNRFMEGFGDPPCVEDAQQKGPMHSPGRGIGFRDIGSY